MPKSIYGTWSSPVTPGMVASVLRLNDVQWDGDTLLWHENRGSQGVLMLQQGSDAPRELSGDLSVKGRVGYGGGEFHALDGLVVFTANGRLYRQSLSGGNARPITPAFGAAASPRISPHQQWVAFVHSYEGVDSLALVDIEGKQWPRKLIQDSDFVMHPVWHPDSRHLAYISWNHPNMPWDGTELHLLTLDDRMEIIDNRQIVGDQNTAIFQPEFSPDGKVLSYISDATGYGQIYLYELASGSHTQITTAQAEHGTAAWVQGLRTTAWSGDRLCYLRSERSVTSLWNYALDTGEHQAVEALNAHYTYFYQLTLSPSSDTIGVIASSSTVPTRVISCHPSRGARIHRRVTSESLPSSAYASTQSIQWTGQDGETVYGLYYPPTSERFEGSGAPPLIVYVHGGPTSQAQSRYEPELQFFATRGFAVLAVNHRGSTGYGREYAQKLYHHWGDYDVADSASGARYLASQGLADPGKFVIMGGSAGGYTVLQSLVDQPGFYRAGVCRYGISNHFIFETHKFEERYTFKLVGDLPEAAALFRQRSPIFHVERICDPVILFQGEDDNVVPRSQSDTMVASLKARGVPHEYHVYPGEGHGFRKPETIEHYLKATLRFLQEHVVFA
jgi:dipeptidyl aminopeptidase/acylaminoacyl peptidase